MNLPRFGVRNPVPINLLMAGLILAGIYSAFTLRRQFFPDMHFDTVVVSMEYPGASPEEIESSVATRLENAIIDVQEVDEIRTTCIEGGVKIVVSFKEGTTNLDDAIDEVRRTVEALQDMPTHEDRPLRTSLKQTLPRTVDELAGEVDAQIMSTANRNIREIFRHFV
ncbi:efflux RND transporter permease subunit [bacterium]|nr:efflux RND transporter permease subunit [bacterium]